MHSACSISLTVDSGFETFVIGGAAAAMAFAVGYFLRGLN